MQGRIGVVGQSQRLAEVKVELANQQKLSDSPEKYVANRTIMTYSLGRFLLYNFVPCWIVMAGTGALVGGIVALIVGIIIAVSGSAAQSYSSSDRAACESGLGQLGQFLSEDAKNRCATMSATNTYGGIGQIAGYGLAGIGIILIGVGAVQKTRGKKSGW